jgi:hypothetical protein
MPMSQGPRQWSSCNATSSWDLRRPICPEVTKGATLSPEAVTLQPLTLTLGAPPARMRGACCVSIAIQPGRDDQGPSQWRRPRPADGTPGSARPLEPSPRTATLTACPCGGDPSACLVSFRHQFCLSPQLWNPWLVPCPCVRSPLSHRSLPS